MTTLTGYQPVGPNVYTDNVIASFAYWADPAGTKPWYGNIASVPPPPNSPPTPFEFKVLNKIKDKVDPQFFGGTVIGTFPDTTSWSRMHDAYAFVFENCTGTGLFGDLRIHNTGDGVSIGPGMTTVNISNAHFSKCRDDAVQNDFGANVNITESFFDGVYIFYSSRPFVMGLPDNSTRVVSITNTIIYIRDMPTGFNGPGHGRAFKVDRGSPFIDPKFSMQNCVMRVDTPHNCCGDFYMPPAARQTGTNSGNTLVWTGEGPWPYGPAPTGWTISTDIGIYNTAVANWYSSHGGAMAQRIAGWSS